MNKKKVILITILFLTSHLSLPTLANASLPSSTNYQIQDYSFGSGGTVNSTSANYKLNGVAGEVEFGRQSSTNFKNGSGLTFLMKSNVPGAPTFSNPSNNYERLKFVVTTSNNPADVTYALQISTASDFSSGVSYVKSDKTIGTTLTAADYLNYNTGVNNWGGSSGSFVTGLAPHTTYYLRAKARQGSFTESEYGPAASALTADPSMTFSVDSNAVTFNNLNSGNSYTDSSKTTVLTTSTNAYNGYIVNAYETGLLTAVGPATIANYISPNSAPTTWSSTGFGYTTTDNSLTGGTADRFTNGGPKYAGFTTSSPGDPVADHPGPVTTAISGEQFTIGYRVTTSNTQKAARYTTTVVYTVVPSY